MSDFEHVLVECEGGIATLTVNRPDRLNALNNDVIEELCEAFTEAFTTDDETGNVGVILLRGAGDKAFVAGADISMLAEQGVIEGKTNSLLGQDLMTLIETGPKPVIACVTGYALGGGCELALACDFRYAATNAVFGLPEVSLGIIPGYGGTQRLPRLVGEGQALELILSGRKIDANEALRIGLVNRVCDPAELDAEARKAAKTILERGPMAVQYAKEAVRRGMQMPLEDGLALEADLFGLISSTDDMREGMQAFLDKRKPGFTGS